MENVKIASLGQNHFFKSNTVNVCGYDCVLGPYQSHFNPCLAAGA